jgi:hypothetical protein
MIPIEIWMSSRLYAPLAFAIGVLVWSVLKDKPVSKDSKQGPAPYFSHPR